MGSVIDAPDDDDGRDPVRVLQPTAGWRAIDLRELFAARELLLVFVARDIRVRYRQTVLGALWAIVQPVTSMVVMSVVFGHFAKMPSDDLPYPVFVYAGMLPWTFFASSVARATQSMGSAGSLVSKVYFPRLVLPLSSVGAPLVDLAVALTVLLGLMLFYGVALTWQLLLAPVVVVGMLLCAVGVGTLFAGVAARFRDVGYLVPFGLQVWMWASPVVYPPSIVPEAYRVWVFLNPMAGFIDAFRAAFLGRPIDATTLAAAFAISTLVFVVGALVFARTEKTLADVL